MSNIQPIIIGVAGGTGSGKSTLAKNIRKIFGNDISMIYHDNYYKSNSHLTFEERKHLNFDHPNAFDTDILIEHLLELKEQKSIEMPIYSFVEHIRENKTITVLPKKVIIVEGILIFENEQLRNLMDIKLFVDTDADIRFIRRLVRDINERGRDIQSVIDQYCTTVKPMHEQFVEPSKKYADLIVPIGGENVVALDMITEKIKNIIIEKEKNN